MNLIHDITAGNWALLAWITRTISLPMIRPILGVI